MSVVERSFSEFLRQPNDVVAELPRHDVVLRRRNAPALRLSEAERDEQRTDAFEALARLLRNLATHNAEAFGVALEDAFPWSTFLPQADRDAFVDHLTRTLVGAADVENYSPVTQLLREWRATAEVWADPTLAHQLNGQLEADGEPVAAPVL